MSSPRQVLGIGMVRPRYGNRWMKIVSRNRQRRFGSELHTGFSLTSAHREYSKGRRSPHALPHAGCEVFDDGVLHKGMGDSRAGLPRLAADHGAAPVPVAVRDSSPLGQKQSAMA